MNSLSILGHWSYAVAQRVGLRLRQAFGRRLRRAAQSRQFPRVDPDGWWASVDGFTKTEAEMLLNWLGANQFEHYEVRYQEGKGFLVRWTNLIG
jgi:hypothetical protein